MEYQSVRLLILDVDGLLTDGTVLLDEQGRESQRFSIQDGLGIRLWRQAGADVTESSASELLTVVTDWLRQDGVVEEDVTVLIIKRRLPAPNAEIGA